MTAFGDHRGGGEEVGEGSLEAGCKGGPVLGEKCDGVLRSRRVPNAER